jgi:hypothetical protein
MACTPEFTNNLAPNEVELLSISLHNCELHDVIFDLVTWLVDLTAPAEE